jgi:guanosine-3',5'-bis(diphosphate) 3'-pyrophosphohydrolase
MAPDLGLLLDSIDFAAKKHKNQRRKVSSEHITINQKDIDQTPYINHPIGVCHILYFEAGCSDISTLISAVLHDTVEDTETTFEEIETSFGSKVMNIVQEVTDDKSLPTLERKRYE